MKVAALRTAIIAVVAAIGLAGSRFDAHAQTFPAKPITLICPWPAGGSTDLHLRKFARDRRQVPRPERSSIENRPGARRHARARQHGEDRRSPTATPSRSCRSARSASRTCRRSTGIRSSDFTYIIGITGYTFGVVVKADSPFKTFKDLIDYAKANPGKLSYGSTGTGTSPHLLMEELSAQRPACSSCTCRSRATPIPRQALMGGHVMAQSDATGWGRHVDAGAFRLLVTFGEKRTKLERADGEGAGHRHRVLLALRHRRAERAWTRKSVKFLHDAFKKALDDPEHLKVLAQLDQVYWYKSSEDYAKWAAETLQGRARDHRAGRIAAEVGEN